MAGILFGLSLAMPAVAEIALTAEQREDLGIKTEPFRQIDVTRRWPASGQVLDASPLVAALSDLHSAETAATASHEEAERSDLLYRQDQNVARKVLDAARAQAATDQAHVMTLRGQLLMAWGRGIVDLSAAARTMLIQELLAGRTSLVRADLLYPMDAKTVIRQTQVAALGQGGEWTAQWLGVLPQTGGATLAGAALLRVPAALPAGQPLSVNLIEASGTLRGQSAPAAAVIRWHGAAWVYEETSPNHFERREVQAARIEGRVLLAGSELPKGNVVIVGARSLLAAELGAADAAEAGGAD
jgi:hypothetical protein